jgi:hypothetical protein
VWAWALGTASIWYRVHTTRCTDADSSQGGLDLNRGSDSPEFNNSEKELCLHERVQHKPQHLFCVLSFQIQLNIAEQSNFLPKDLSVIYVSLAVTLKDYGQFSQSLYYHEKNLRLWKGNDLIEVQSHHD